VVPPPPTTSQTPAPTYHLATACQLEDFATNATELPTKGLDKSLCANITRQCWWTSTTDLRNHYPISTKFCKGVAAADYGR